ncbi:GTP-binding protein [Ahrensia marina]|uniref:ArgK/MeaB family GTPase n=1 Tax=Ahrensia marina TaxID=1514904 RepID=UPI0035CE9B0D
MLLEELKSGGKRAIARALSRLDRLELTLDDADLLDAAYAEPQGIVIGLTGPPGVGKSTLTQALIERIRAADKSVAVIAVDPSSQSTGGALLGDRTRLSLDPEDRKLFVRSLAARNRLGGLSDHAIAAAMLLRALFDVVLVETVGIGQSDADVALIADRSLLCVQPGSGDALQFMKAGIMEWPDVIAVTKADTGPLARRARADVEGALGLAAHKGDGPSVCLVSARTGEGVDGLVDALLTGDAPDRAGQAERLVRDAITRKFGSYGASKLSSSAIQGANGPFGAVLAASEKLKT